MTIPTRTFSLLLALLLTAAGGLLAPGAAVAQEEEWHPEQVYGPQMAEEDDGPGEEARSSAAADIADWAQIQEADGEAGRPLPLAGSWMADQMFGPKRFIEMIEQGHHVLPTFSGVSLGVIRKHLQGGDALEKQIESWRPHLEYAREHRLPIVFREWNWSNMPPDFQRLQAEHEERDLSLEDDLRVILDGKPSKQSDPFGPVEGWRAWGEMWFSNELIRRAQEIYPDPPMVIFLNNNEGPKVRSAGQLPDDYERMIAFLDGEKPANQREKERAIRRGYQERYTAMFEAAREAMVSSTWKKNVKFVGYNLVWDTGYIGQGNRPRPGIWFEPDEGWLDWRMYDGVMPELYDNDWQPGKRDYGRHSPQSEAMNYYAAQPWLFERDPDLYWASIVWEGGRVNDIFRGRRSSSKPYRYITRGQRWDFARYEGWVQFVLWTTRPRSMREFRFPPSEKHAYDEGTFMALVRSVDRVWNEEPLAEFWRHGKLVPNPDEKHPWALSNDQPDWLRDFERWYLLTCDANPSRDQWDSGTVVKVFAQALVLGEAPQRRWLVYAHAPRGAVAEPTVTLPGYGKLTLPSVSRSGSFYLVEEQDDNLRTLIPGGPAELSLDAESNRVAAGDPVHFEAGVAHASETEITGFTWDFGDGQSRQQETLEPIERTFDEPGTYVVTVRGKRRDGDPIIEQTAVHVGEKPAEAVKYDLPLDEAFAWEGPWGDSGAPDHELVTYRHLPNAGSLPNPVLVGGTFVDDDERGRVLELDGSAADQGVWMIRSPDTVQDRHGHTDQTISFRFKADSTEGRQMLYAQGYEAAGFNVYLDGDTLYAGSWATSGLDPSDSGSWHPVWGRDWDGHWLKHEGIERGRWYHVTFALEDATDEVEDDKQRLSIDGETVATGPGVRIPRQYVPPRLGVAEVPFRNHMSRFHDSGEKNKAKPVPFRGRIDHLRLVVGQASSDEERAPE